MSFTEIKKTSLELIKGHWGKLVIITLLYFIVSFLISIIPIVGFIFSFIFSTPITYGYLYSLIKLTKNEEVEIFDFLIDGFKSTIKVWKVIGSIFLRLFIPILILFGFALLVTYYTLPILEAVMTNNFSLNIEISPFISIGLLGYFITAIYITYKFLIFFPCLFLVIDNPNEKTNFIVKKSKEIMKGHIFKLILFILSFIGWIILSVITLGIGFLFLIPYCSIATYLFYQKLIPEKL